MKGWLALHENKWHPIKDVVDTGKPAHEKDGGNVYHLEGVEKPVHQSKIKDMKPPEKTTMKKREDKIPGGLADNKSPKDFKAKSLKEGMKVESEHTSDKGIAQEIAMDHLTEDKKYYKKLKEVEKQDRIEITADGKQEIVEGKEPLKKDPKSRWNGLKKALDSSTAFMDIQDAMADDEQPQQEQPQEAQAAPAPEEQQPQEAAPEQAQPEEQPQEEQSEQDYEQAEQQIKDALKEQGYSDPEIAYIVHGHHAPELSETDAAKAKATNDMSGIDTNHAARQADLEHEHTKRMNDLEHEKAKSEIADPETESNHRKRMLDLEHEAQKKKISKEDLEIEHRKRLQELELAAKKKEIDKQDPAEDIKAQEAQMQLQHKKRMSDVEYSKAKKEAEKEDPIDDIKRMQAEFDLHMKKLEGELELKYKEKELQLNLKLKEEATRLKSKMQEEQMKQDHVVNTKVKTEQAKHNIAAAKVAPPKEPTSATPKKPVGKK